MKSQYTGAPLESLCMFFWINVGQILIVILFIMPACLHVEMLGLEKWSTGSIIVFWDVVTKLAKGNLFSAFQAGAC